MNRLVYLKEAPPDEIEAMKLFYKRIGRDAVWDILELLNEAENLLTQEEICEQISRKNIGTDLRFLVFVGFLNRIHIAPEHNHTYLYGIDFNFANRAKEKEEEEQKKEHSKREKLISSRYHILQCDLNDSRKRQEFIKQFKPKKRKKPKSTATKSSKD